MTGAKGSCSFDGCGRGHYGAGYCNAHWQQHRSGKVLVPIRTRTRPGGTCGAEACERPAYRRGLCQTHYRRMLRGDTSGGIQPRKAINGPCTVPDCETRASARQLCRRHYRIAGSFNLGAARIGALFADPKCGICGTSDPGGRDFHIDHDHACCAAPGASCGQCVRGLLCAACNLGLGMFKDSPALLERAIEYLEAPSDA